MAYDICACGRRKAAHGKQCIYCRTNEIAIPREHLSPEEAAWVAGILEGEGTFTQSKRTPGSWWIAVRMTDQDVVSRLFDITQIGRLTTESRSKPGYKDVYAWQVGVKPHREWLVRQTWSWLGTRRRSRILELWPQAVLA